MSLTKTMTLGSSDYVLGASLGITTTLIKDYEEPSRLFNDADNAMYDAKNQGKNQYVNSQLSR